jgi:ankyrin repeat protein
MDSKFKFVIRDHENDMTGLMIACLDNNYNQVVHQVETLKSNVNYQRRNGQTALMYAIYKNNLKIAKYLCENGANKDLTDEIGNTALMHAIYKYPEIAMYLITNGADINIKNSQDETAIHFASMAGNLSIIKMLFERGANINVYNINKHTPIMMACGNKHFKCVKYLITNGADINVHDLNYDNLLHGCMYHNTYDILLLLLTNKNLKIINSRNQNNLSPLMYAIKLNKIKYIELLLKYGADTYTWDIENNTPLLYATETNNYELTELLLKYKANPNLYFTSNEYKSPLYNAVQNDNQKIIQLLFDYGANDLMYIYIETDNYEKFKNLITRDNINKTNSNGDTLLYYAAQKNNLDFVELLLENGADPNINNIKEKNQSPLYHAIINNNYEMVKVLLKYNADYNNRLYGYNCKWHMDMNNLQKYKDEYKLSESIMATVVKYRGKYSEIYNCLDKLNAVLFYDYD